MAAKGATWGSNLLKLLFQATAIANIADNAATSPLTNLYCSLHTASPAGGNQSTSEAAYTSYARQAVARTSSGFTVTGEVVTLVADLVFPTATGGTETETYLGIGTASSGAGILLYYLPLAPTIPVTSGVQPTISATSSVTES